MVEVTKLEAEIAQSEAELARIGELEVEFKRFVEEVSNWTSGRDPWSLMDPVHVGKLGALMKRAGEEFREFAAY